VIFQDFPGPGIFKKKKSGTFQEFPGGVGTLISATGFVPQSCAKIHVAYT